MLSRLPRLLANLCLAATSVAVTFAFLEFIVFGAILKPDDVLPNVTIDGVVRYEPNTRAVFRHPNGSRTTVNVNADGWNSSKAVYRVAREPGRLRVAVIGDSYVHGSFVETAEGFPEVLERTLVANGRAAEVYRFGMDGAPLSQYLHMLRHEVLPYKPDVVVVQLIHNDFDETYRFLKTRYASSFLKLQAGADGRIVEVPPVPLESGLAETLRASSTFRYLYYETNLYLKAKSLISRWYWGGDAEHAPAFIQSAVDIRNIADHDANRRFAHHVLAEMQALAVRHGFKLAFAMDGVREAVYAGAPPDRYEVGRLNTVAAELTTELGLPFLDLQQTFATHWAANRRRFEFDFDWHWNPLANRLVGEAIARLLLTEPRLLAGPRQASEAAERAVPPRRT